MYIGIISRVGLKSSYLPMSNAVSQEFAISESGLDLGDNKKFGSSCKEGGNEDSATLLIWTVRSSFEQTDGSPFCSSYESSIHLFFLNNQRKRSNELIVKQNVAEFKRRKRQKT